MITLRRMLGLRLSVWYATVFILSTLVLVVLTYALLASSLAQRDHDIIRATLREYASRYELGGLAALQRAVELEERTGSVEQLYVRVIGRDADALFVRSPQAWSAYAVEELSALFNTMLDRINGLIAAMGESIDNVAHDLRTPIARLRGIAERALQAPDSPEGRDARKEALADCLEEADRILSILNTLMDISEAEAGVLQLRREPVGLRGLLADVVELYEDVADAKQVAVTLEPGDEVVVSGARDRLRQVVANLVDNAIQYTPETGRVRIAVGRQRASAVVTVTDTGVGIAAEHLPRIWERLYRADPSRSEPGLGLGLSLVKAYVHAHGGQAEAQSDPGRGSTFTVRLPIEP